VSAAPGGLVCGAVHSVGRLAHYRKIGTGNPLGNSDRPLQFSSIRCIRPDLGRRCPAASTTSSSTLPLDWNPGNHAAWKHSHYFRNAPGGARFILFLHLLMVTYWAEPRSNATLPVFRCSISRWASWALMDQKRRRVAQTADSRTYLWLFWNPPWAVPYENNLAVVRFCRTSKGPCRYVETFYSPPRMTRR